MSKEDSSGSSNLLDGYSVVEWPDLTCDRAPSSETHVTSEPFDNFDLPAHGSLFLAAISRILGAYCSTTDVLIAVQSPSKPEYVFIRVAWADTKDWMDVAARISTQLRRTAKAKLTLDDIRRKLELSDKQLPCPVLVQFAHSKRKYAVSDFPAVFTFNSKKSSLSLSAPKTLFHPSISRQILTQVIFVFQHAKKHSKSPIAANPSFPPNLSSIYSRLPEEEITQAYPHIPLVIFATEYLERRAKSNRDAIAVQWFPELSIDEPNLTSDTITYGELDRKASQFGRWLVAQGLHQEDRVAVCLSRDLRFHAAFMGILRAGGCYVPIDPELPLERKAYITRDSGARFVLTSLELSAPDLFKSATIYVDSPDVVASIEQEQGDDFNLATPEGLAYILYTSGTTGNPKGCLLTNHGLAQAIIALSSTAADVRMKDLSQGRYLAVASIAFDVHLAETIVPMALGMPLISAPRSQLLENLPLYVKILGVTHLGIVPSLIEATLNASKDEGGGLALRYIASGGEKMSDWILDKWANHPQVRLANFYGPSEVTIGCCARYMNSSTPRANIGKPLANVSGYVVDADLNILPRGALGELVVEGPLVGRGYHGRPDLTAKVFMEWPEKGRWAYRTGDLVRMMPDSTLEILGRIDTQIKVRGVRIESEGISAIVRKPSTPTMVLDAATVLAKHPALGNEQLVSFVTWDQTVPISTRKSIGPSLSTPPNGLIKSIRSVCQAELAGYMRPNHIIPLNWLPLSSNGKADAKILVEIFKSLNISDLAALISDEASVSSRNCTQQELDVFEVLERHAPSYTQRPHPELNIFECGLDSMGIIRFASDLKTTFAKTILATDIMKNPCLQDISRLIDDSASKGALGETSLISIGDKSRAHIQSLYPADSIEDILPTFPVQEGVLSRSVEDTSLYVQHVILQLQQGISTSRLHASWQAAIDRHPILRTVLYVDRSAWQIVFRTWDLSSVWTDHTLDASTSETFRDRFYALFASKIVKDINENISTTPPIRFAVFGCSGVNFLVLSIHHALYDGASLPFLLKGVENNYLGLPCIPTASLRDVLIEISKRDLTAAQQFWTKSFWDFSWPRPAFDQSANALSGTKYLTIPFTRKLSYIKEVANKKQVTLQALLSFIFAYAIGSHIYRSADVSFGVIRSGRMLPVDNIDMAQCPTIAVLPMRVRFKDSNATLNQVQREISAMMEHEHVPLGKVQSWLRPGEPLFEVLFSVSVQQVSEAKIWKPCHYEPPVPDYPLSVEAVVNLQEDSVAVRAAFLDGRISEALVTRLLQEFESVALTLDRDEKVSLSPASTNGSAGNHLQKKSDEKEDLSQPLLDPKVVDELQRTICDFLEVPTTVLTNRMSFISLGLDSIKAVGLAKRIRQLGYDISSSEILKASTLKRLVQVVSNNKQKKDQPFEQYAKFSNEVRSYVPEAEVQLSCGDQVQIFPTTALQSGMLSQTIGSDGRLYIHTFPLMLAPTVDFDHLKSAWEAAAMAIDILRTSFHFIPDNGLWAQIVHSENSLKWATQDFDKNSDRISVVQQFVGSIQCTDEFAFATPPIWLRLFRSHNQEPSVLALVMHHALYDGLSIKRLLDSVQSLYRQRPISYKVQFTDLLPDFFRQQIEGTSFWAKKLADLERSLLPVRAAGSVSQYKLIRDVPVQSSDISKLLKGTEVTLQCLLQGSLTVALAKLTHSNDVVFGHVVSGRGSQGTEEVVGPILNTIPCRVVVKDDQAAAELLQDIHRFNMDTIPWHQASLRSIQKELKITKLWDCLFTFQPLVEPSSENRIWSMQEFRTDHDVHIQYPLHVEIEQTTSGFSLRFACRSSALSQEELEEFAASLSTVILHIIADPRRSISTAVLDTAVAETENAAPSTIVEATTITSTIPPALLTTIRALAPDADITLDTPLPVLGIDSITAIQISGKCRRLGLRLSATQILNSNTVKDLVQQARVQGSVEATTAKVSEGLFQPLSAQEKDSIAHRFGSDAKYIENVSVTTSGMKWAIGGWQRTNGSLFQYLFTFKLPDDIDVARFKNSWYMFIRRHELLRSTFATAPGGTEPRLVTFSKDFKFDHWAEERVEDTTFYRSLLVRMREMVSDPLDISRPPIRATLFRSSSQIYLILHIHHFQYDAWSMQVLLNDLSSIYNDQEPWAGNDLRAFTSLFNTNETRLNQQRDFWRTALAPSFKPSLLPSLLNQAKTKPHIPTGQLNLIMVPFALSNISQFEARALALGVTLQTVLLAAWAQVQANRSRTEESTFGVWQVSRSSHIEGIERLAVPCVTVLPIHVKLGGSLVDVTNRIQKDLSSRLSQPVIEHSDLVNIAKWVGMPEETPIFNVNVNVVKIPVMLQKGGLFEPVKAPHYVAKVSVPTVTPTFDKLAVAPLAQNDVVVDIVLYEESDSVLMSIEALDTIMTEDQAKDVIREWASIVTSTLGFA